MRTLLTSYPLIIFLAALVALLYPSCELANPILEELPLSATITLDFSDPNTRGVNTGGFRYLYEGESYLATYLAWEAWSCATGPDFFAAWDDTSLTVWLAHCPATLNLESITAQTGDSAPLPLQSWNSVAGAHEPTYQLTLDPANYVDIENGATTINLSFTYN
ncbi:hypothetical protein [Neolewinella agarilytica]|uniref:Uncharacterized protein n=1 Tax=Neolewinella agarilytica TaxID=478744 RepID=A0A1H9H792_9BACT|nr:hypothetical protein [Neolewinella agarilytica]SEQ58180.1 hypothetical protein SAMN05444359_11244 [Neolewinella agarilytica]